MERVAPFGIASFVGRRELRRYRLNLRRNASGRLHYFQFAGVFDRVPRFSDDTAAHFQSFDEERPARDLESSL